MKKIAIRFGDNDFFYTFTGVLNLLLDAHKNGHTALPTDKDKLLFIINNVSLGIYLSHQNQFRYTNGYAEKDYIRYMKKYLRIRKSNLLIDEEYDKYYRKVGGDDNGETFVLDLELGSVSYI